MDEIVARLRADTQALGVWLLAAMPAEDNRDQSELLAAAVADASIEPPMNVLVAGETYVDFGKMQFYALPLDSTNLVVVFDDRRSLGLIRLRARKARAELQRMLLGQA